MRADFSRSTFRPEQHFSAVLWQQGRVQLDADVNEQAMINLHLLRTLAADVIGRHGGPADGFEIAYVPATSGQPADLKITRGRYYVNGMLVDSAAAPALRPLDGGPPAEEDLTYWNQPFAFRDQKVPADELPGAFPFLAYLKVFEQLVTVVEDPALLEPALGPLAPDTTARIRTVWQVLPLVLNVGDGQEPATAFDDWVRQQTCVQAWLAARTEQPAGVEDDPCIIAPDAAYRGPENQLYRVEIHEGGAAGPQGPATFKWSRDNGSVVFPVTSVMGDWVSLTHLGRDGRGALEVGDWTEVIDDSSAARGEPSPLLRVAEVDVSGRRVRLAPAPGGEIGRSPARHPLLRRWDHRTPTAPGAQELVNGAVSLPEGRWQDLEDGIQVWFHPGGHYRPGDHWLIPARTLTTDVEWPTDGARNPLLAPPAGGAVHYAPLAWIVDAGTVTSLRRTFTPAAGH